MRASSRLDVAVRLLALIAAVVLPTAVLAAASGAPAAAFGGPNSVHVKNIAGVVRDVPTGFHVHSSATAHTANLPYDGGPVLHSNRPHLIFWQPSGSGLTFDPGYVSLIETFLMQVAADSRKPTNVYSLSGQYRDDAGPAAYASKYGRAVIDTDPLPANGCTEPPPPAGPLWLQCVNDGQIEAELEHVVRVEHLPTTDRDIFFLLTPNGLGSCEASGPDDCALGGATSGSYCGYHSSTPDDSILYAVIPYNAVSGHCQSDNPRPNGSTADPTLSTLSHEHNEMVTDPLGTAWIDSSFNEDGDLCLTEFGPSRGGSGDRAWNQVIHGGHYYLQEEWSNDDSSCRQRDEADQVSFTAPSPAIAGKRASFVASGVDPDGSIVSYRWFFGTGRQAVHRRAWHSFARTGTYRVVLRTTDSSGNYAYAARLIRVALR